MLVSLIVLLISLIATKYLISEKMKAPLFDVILVMVLIPIGTLNVLFERLSKALEDLGEFIEDNYPKFGPDLNQKLF